ncbi:acyl-CoA dehydrogenase family protein [Streptomyces sp. MUM 2J]|uniref:acyl-CoA dehydrogenase family protein n=1 Tax=Streptomyces sp. MUM 2J TaxID=2791987 RepID=UPI001F033640|nr:acyl-CoA dehydrogenase family protein [Streptomyces sp. MUM 2J]MCH0564656.1 acyl-CoA/acyl-ACP dehydrogenase [Streptomyces sp. MUM 2J]
MTAELLKRIRDFTANELAGKDTHFDELPEQPTVEASRLHDLGLANWWVPVQYGGLGVSLTESVDIVSELAYGDAGFAFGAFLPVLGGIMLQHFGTEELARPALEALAAEGGRIAVLGSEEEAGSELVRITTTFRTEGDRLVLNGDKYFSTNTDTAGLLLVLARSADDTADFAVVAIPRDTPGVEIVKRWDLLGVRGTGTYRVRLDDCAVPSASRLDGGGLRILEAGLNASRILIAACAVGIARRVRDLSMEYAAVKRLKGAPLTENAVFAGKLGQMETLIDVMRNQCRAAAGEFDHLLITSARGGTGLHRVGTLRSALAAKLFCGQAGWEVASTGSELFGGLGYTQDHPIGKLVRDMRFVAVVEGGEDVVRDLMYARYVVPARKRR